jgi:hypothetical protein
MFPDQIPSPQPSPRFGGEREPGVVSRCALNKLILTVASLYERTGNWKADGHRPPLQKKQDCAASAVEFTRHISWQACHARPAKW